MKLLLDAGHSGVTFGRYWTPGKRSPQIPPGFYEGEFNRKVCTQVAEQAPKDILFLNPGPYPISLKFRVQQINKIVSDIKRRLKEDAVLLSVHANAAGSKGWNKAKGTTVFIHKKASEESGYFARDISSEMRHETALTSRGIKKANFQILRVKCPAVLLECLFMTNHKEVWYARNGGGIEACGNAILEAWYLYNDQ